MNNTLEKVRRPKCPHWQDLPIETVVGPTEIETSMKIKQLKICEKQQKSMNIYESQYKSIRKKIYIY